MNWSILLGKMSVNSIHEFTNYGTRRGFRRNCKNVKSFDFNYKASRKVTP